MKKQEGPCGSVEKVKDTKKKSRNLAVSVHEELLLCMFLCLGCVTRTEEETSSSFISAAV